MQEGREFDVNYNTKLSQDASAALAESYDLMSKADRCIVRDRLIKDASPEDSDFRSWNWSRSSALAASAEKLEVVGVRLNDCSSPVGRPYIP